MNKDNLTKKTYSEFAEELEKLDLPYIENLGHRRRLRTTLLNSGYFKQNNIMPIIKKVMPIGVITILAIVAVSVVSLTSNPTPVSAKEMAEKSFQVVASLSPEEQVALKINTGLDQFNLEEAKRADDLKALTYSEFIDSYPQLKKDVNIIFSSDLNQGSALEDLKFLQYTKNSDQQAKQIVLAINPENNLPVFGYAESIYENGMFSTEFFGKYQSGADDQKDFDYGWGYSIDSNKVECEVLNDGQVICDSEVEMREINNGEVTVDSNIPDQQYETHNIKCKIISDGQVICEEGVMADENYIEINLRESDQIFRGVNEQFLEPGELPNSHYIKDIER